MLQYLKLAVVDDFIDWLAANLDQPLFAHAYVDRRHGPRTFTGLPDALSQYFWKHNGALGAPGGTCLTSSNAVLNALRQALNTGMKNSNDAATLSASIEVMAWGGVRAGNARWLTINTAKLVSILSSTTAALASQNLAHGLLATRGQMRFNAGMTKVYSLLVDDFIIYDSRVAAALDWIIVKYCQARQLPAVPAELAFPWAPAKEAANAKAPKNRDPRQHNYYFPRLAAGEPHAVWNLKASGILAEVLRRAPFSAFNTASTIPALRRLEAALFMIGYDLPHGRSSEVAVSPREIDDEEDWTECFTAARGRMFHYRIQTDGIYLQDGRVYPAEVINSMLNILRSQFKSGHFPLANSATDVRSGNSKPGVGSAYFQATADKGNPPDSSALVAVLHDLGALNHTAGRRDPWSINDSEFAHQSKVDVSVLFTRQLELNDAL